MLSAISTILYNLKNVKNTHGGVSLLVKLGAEAESNTFTESNKSNKFTRNKNPPWVFSRFSNCANGTKSSKASHLSTWDSYVKERLSLKSKTRTLLSVLKK